MKVLFATYPMAFHTPGGGEQQLLAYERHLPALGVEVARFDSWNPHFLDHDIVHFFSTVGGSSHFCAFVKQLGLPLIVSSSLWATEQTAANFPIEEIRHQLYLADRVVTNSEVESRTLARLLGLMPEKFAVVRNAVDRHFLDRADPLEFRQKFDVNEDFVLCVGNIEPRKNQLRLAQAMRDVEASNLVLVGAVRDSDYQAAVLEAGGSRLRHVGTVAHDSTLLASAYAACRVFALPSLYETPGLAALEAAAQGAPIVITREGSTEEYFGPAASYVDPLSVASISSAIRQALAIRSGHSPMSTLAPPTWEDVSAELNEVYRNVL
jgi:glycosyltransferase involved in cell wall biosynthesis